MGEPMGFTGIEEAAAEERCSTNTKCDAAQLALARLREGNKAYLAADANDGDISTATIERLFEEGQSPFACVVSCADSRVVPEHIFMAGLGELFCIRVAGNVVGDMELASCAYAADHLHVPLIVVLGHTRCGAIEAAMEAADDCAHDAVSALAPLVAALSSAIGGETDPYEAGVANTNAAVRGIIEDSTIGKLVSAGKLSVCGAIYHTDSGEVEFL